VQSGFAQDNATSEKRYFPPKPEIDVLNRGRSGVTALRPCFFAFSPRPDAPWGLFVDRAAKERLARTGRSQPGSPPCGV